MRFLYLWKVILILWYQYTLTNYELRSVHNVHIEHLWVDVMAQVVAAWLEFFMALELWYGLDINNVHHIWLVHCLFLSLINQQLQFFAKVWNQHKLQIQNGPNHSPADLFGFNMIVHGICGDPLLGEEMGNEDIEVYSVDQEGLGDDRLLHLQRENNSADKGSTSWIGWIGPPQNLNKVSIYPLSSDVLTSDELIGLAETVCLWYGLPDNEDKLLAWSHRLGYAKALQGNLF